MGLDVVTRESARSLVTPGSNINSTSLSDLTNQSTRGTKEDHVTSNIHTAGVDQKIGGSAPMLVPKGTTPNLPTPWMPAGERDRGVFLLVDMRLGHEDGSKKDAWPALG